ncbi:hypothetical protein, variant, partial [Aphanomyces invadans]
MRRRLFVGDAAAAALACMATAQATDDILRDEVNEYKFTEHDVGSPSQDDEIQIYSTDISGTDLRDQAHRGSLDGGSGPSFMADMTVPFVPVVPSTLDIVAIPDAIVLSPDQIRDVSIAVQAILLAGVIVVAIIGRIVSIVRTRRAVEDSIRHVYRLVDVAAVRQAIAESTNAEFHAAASLHLRLMEFLRVANDLAAETYYKEFDHARWMIVNRVTKEEDPTNVAGLLEHMATVVTKGEALVATLAAQDVPVPKDRKRAIESHLETLRARKSHMAKLHVTIRSKIEAAIEASKHRNGMQLDDWKRLKDLWISLGLSEVEVNEPDGWYQRNLRNLELQQATLFELYKLKQRAESSIVVVSSSKSMEPSVLDQMSDLLKKAKREEWDQDEFYQLELFVQTRADHHIEQQAMVLAQLPASPLPRSLGNDVEERTDVQRDPGYKRGMDLHDVLQMQMAQTRALQDNALAFHKLNTDRIMLHERKMHLETLDQRQRQFELTVQAKRERDEAKYQRKLQDATAKLERKLTAKRLKQAEKDAKETAAANAKFLALRVHEEWALVRHVLVLNMVVVILVMALVFWDAVTSREWLSSTCDVRQSYWTPTHLSVLGCKAMYGAQVASVMVLALLLLSVFSYLNLSLWGVAILGGAALYTFRASWQHVLLRLPHVLWLVGFNYCVGSMLALDGRRRWTLYMNWRPIVVYIAYPIVSLAVSLAMGMKIACDSPIDCFHDAIAWCRVQSLNVVT